MCESKTKEEPIVSVVEINAQLGKPIWPFNYPCHICGIEGHNLTNCSKFGKM
jgi:hypothetical protein